MKLLSFLFLVSVVSSQNIYPGSCPTQAVVSNFDTAAYLGKWYENRNYFAIFQLFGRCVTAEYSDAGNGLITVVNTQQDLFGTSKKIQGQAKKADPQSTTGELSVSFAGKTPFSANPTAVTDPNYLVLDTDYTSYSIVWSCNDKGIFNTQILWLLTREQSPPESVVNDAVAKIKARGLDTLKLKVTDQTNCGSFGIGFP